MSNLIVKNTVYNYYKRFNEGINFNDLDDSSEDYVINDINKNLVNIAIQTFIHTVDKILSIGKYIKFEQPAYQNLKDKLLGIYNIYPDKSIFDNIYKASDNTLENLLVIGLDIFGNMKYLTWIDLSDITPYQTHESIYNISSFYQINKDALNYEKDYDYIDLSLPHNILWCTKNIGADNMYEDGKYFYWGDVKGYKTKEDFDNGEYSYDAAYSSKLNAENDAATVLLGNNYRMPTAHEFDDLIEHTVFVWIDSLHCGVFISRKDITKYIVMPASGYYRNFEYECLSYNKLGQYWSSTKPIYNKGTAYLEVLYLYFMEGHLYVDEWNASYLYPIRAIKINK